MRIIPMNASGKTRIEHDSMGELAVPADATLSAEEEARLAHLLEAEPSDCDD